MSKSADAFRTISEVAEWLDTPAHVLRFWESKFTQVKPVKRAGGRRYYRPADMRLLAGIKRLLHEDGMTIKGVQKILREQGIKHVSSLCELSLSEDDDLDAVELETVPEADPVDTVVPFTKPETEPEAEPDLLTKAEDPVAEVEETDVAENTDQDVAALDADADVVTADAEGAEVHPEQVETAAEPDVAPDEPEPNAEPVDETPATVDEDIASDVAEIAAQDDASEVTEVEEETAVIAEEETSALPSFLQNSMEERRADEAEDTAEVESAEAEPPVDSAPPAEIDPVPSALTYLSQIRHLSPDAAQQIAPIVEKLKQVAR
jgi:DNA-binding transcriptional MerR regulator